MKASEQMEAKIERMEDDIANLREALESIVTWSEAYPLDIFPEPNLIQAKEALRARGMTLDSISARAVRHAVEGVGKIARAALSRNKEGG